MSSGEFSWHGIYNPKREQPVKVDFDKTDLWSTALRQEGYEFNKDTGLYLHWHESEPVTRKAAISRLERRGWRIHEVQVHRKRKAA